MICVSRICHGHAQVHDRDGVYVVFNAKLANTSPTHKSKRTALEVLLQAFVARFEAFSDRLLSL